LPLSNGQLFRKWWGTFSGSTGTGWCDDRWSAHHRFECLPVLLGAERWVRAAGLVALLAVIAQDCSAVDGKTDAAVVGVVGARDAGSAFLLHHGESFDFHFAGLVGRSKAVDRESAHATPLLVGGGHGDDLFAVILALPCVTHANVREH